jgi:hypothetical protein
MAPSNVDIKPNSRISDSDSQLIANIRRWNEVRGMIEVREKRYSQLQAQIRIAPTKEAKFDICLNMAANMALTGEACDGIYEILAMLKHFHPVLANDQAGRSLEEESAIAIINRSFDKFLNGSTHCSLIRNQMPGEFEQLITMSKSKIFNLFNAYRQPTSCGEPSWGQKFTYLNTLIHGCVNRLRAADSEHKRNSNNTALYRKFLNDCV